MSSEQPPVPIARMQVLYRLPGMDAVTVRRDVEFPAADGAPLKLDLYLPPGASAASRPPVVLIGEGYPEAGFERMLGCSFRAMGPVASWARLLAASGMAAIAGSNRAPAADARALLDFVRADGAQLGVDGGRIALWASSGNAPVALSLLLGRGNEAIRAAAFLYPFLLDLDGGTEVATAAATFRFADACAGRTLADLSAATPLLLVRAGRDETTGLNAALDRFTARTRERGLALTLVDHPEGVHAFDLFDDGAAARRAIEAVLDFLRRHLAA